MSKRVRTGPKRPMEKDITNLLDSINTSMSTSNLHTTAAAETLVRLVGYLSWSFLTNAGSFGLVLVRNRDGAAVSTMTLTAGQAIYEPVGDVLWSGIFKSAAGVVDYVFVDVKGMRKLRSGDRILLLSIGQAADTVNLAGSFTAFFKQ